MIRQINGHVLDDSAVHITIDTEKTACKTFFTMVKIPDIFAEFSSDATTKDDSVNGATTKAIKFLKDLSQMITDFKSGMLLCALFIIIRCCF